MPGTEVGFLMSKNDAVRISALRESELGEAVRIVRLAFGTFLGVPDPMQFMGDRDLMTPRWPARGHQCRHALGFVWILWAPDSAARTLESRCGAAALGRHRKDSRRLETSAQRSVHLCAEREARGPLQQ